ncbi:hypothetical protein C6P46_000258 [Rhodotorula mucilaginosa]|uniref:Uncharacterized protein n=1 Tax=Rhodotorula mucilaginosa TaxID=5537 RepID=A0A9P7B821_RHOMI|nr:hypothetical protein C6P46_000258 [Rhodotorula mucilaginosa]TKA52145.1 hypothetical protein B0A53_04989 [Rhodotorula sp. CCFEE 5036]
MAQSQQEGVATASPVFVRALYGYNGTDSASLSFRQGDVIEVLSTAESGWWDGIVLRSSTRGWFPSNYVEPISEVEAMWTVRLADSRLDRRESQSSQLSGLDVDDYSTALGERILAGEVDEGDPLPDFMVERDVELSSFSMGGDIFTEIAAAAQADYAADPPPQPAPTELPEPAGQEDLWKSPSPPSENDNFLDTNPGDGSRSRSPAVMREESQGSSAAATGSSPGATRWTASKDPAVRRTQTPHSEDSDDSELDAAFPASTRRLRQTSGTSVTQDFARRLDVPTSSEASPPSPHSRTPSAPIAEPKLPQDLETSVRSAMQQLSEAADRSSHDPAAREELFRRGQAAILAVRTALQAASELSSGPIHPPTERSLSPLQGATSPRSLAELRPVVRRLISAVSQLEYSLQALSNLLDPGARDAAASDDTEDQQRAHAMRSARARLERHLTEDVVHDVRSIDSQLATFFQHLGGATISERELKGLPAVPRDAFPMPRDATPTIHSSPATSDPLVAALSGNGFGPTTRGASLVAGEGHGLPSASTPLPSTARNGPGAQMAPAMVKSASSLTSSDGLADTSRSHDGTSLARTSATSLRGSVDSDFFFSGVTMGDLRQPRPSSSRSSLADAPISAASTVPLSALSHESYLSGVHSSSSSGSGVEVLRAAQPVPHGWDDTRRGSAMTWSTISSTSVLSGRQGSFASNDQLRNSTRSSSKNIQKLLGEVPPEAVIREEPQSVPWFLERDWDDECLSFTVDHTIRGGTLKGLVIAATSHEGRVDSSYLSAFLMTYRTFCTPHQLLDELIHRYRVMEPAGVSPDERKEWEAKKQRPIRARVTNLLKAWVREYMDHEDLDRDLLNRIRDFALSSMTEKGQALQICKSVDERMQGAARRPIGNLAPGSLPAPIVPRNLKKFKLVDIDTLEIARQLTIMDSRLFQRITAQECLSKAWPKQFSTDAANISAMIDMSNAVTRWVTETILAQDDLKKRVAIIKHFVSIAERCLSLNNFSTLIHILAGLNSTPVHRLRRTWEIVSQKTMTTLAMLNRVMRPDKNYKEYREILRKSAPPCVPFLGVYLTDWTFIGDGNPDMLRERPHQINFNKRQKASELILMIKLHQATTYNLQAVPPIATFLQDSLFPPGVDTANVDQRLYDKSLRVEPRERDDEKIARLLSESGFL